ncbi:hypothetical protein CHH59_11450 [Shouchella clausii]|nr:hypothetical protein CHH59_11450 [Shouchella clausii]
MCFATVLTGQRCFIIVIVTDFKKIELNATAPSLTVMPLHMVYLAQLHLKTAALAKAQQRGAFSTIPFTKGEHDAKNFNCP